MGSESDDEVGGSLDGTWEAELERVDVCRWNGFSLSLNQVKDSHTNARHAQKPMYLKPRLGLEMME